MAEAARLPAPITNSSTRWLPVSATNRSPSGPNPRPPGARSEAALVIADTELVKSTWPITASGAIRPGWLAGRGGKRRIQTARLDLVRTIRREPALAPQACSRFRPGRKRQRAIVPRVRHINGAVGIHLDVEREEERIGRRQREYAGIRRSGGE